MIYFSIGTPEKEAARRHVFRKQHLQVLPDYKLDDASRWAQK